MPGLINFPGGLNSWMGFASQWGGSSALAASAVENGIRAGLIGAGAAAGYGGYNQAQPLANYLFGDN